MQDCKIIRISDLPESTVKPILDEFFATIKEKNESYTEITNMEKPKTRSDFRRKLGKQFYIFKRKFDNQFSDKKFAKLIQKEVFREEVFAHKSFILRPLKEVEMYLQHNKKKNLELAIAHLNGIVIQPEETFSLWKLVGKPSAQKGYLEGLILNQGKVDKGIGGGLCQLGNLLFWIIAHSPLTITERHRHSFDVFPDINRTIPFGAGATLSYNYIDFQFKNETTNTFQLVLAVKGEYLYGRLVAKNLVQETYKVIEKNHSIRQMQWGNYARYNQIFQQKYKGENLLSEKLLFENYALLMYDPFLEYKPD